MNLSNFIGSIGLKGNLAQDTVFLILFLLASFIVSFALGKHRLLVSFLGVYAAYAVVNIANFDFLKEPSTKSLVFLAIFVGFVLFFSGIIRGSISGHGPMFVAKMTCGTAIMIGLALSIILSWYTPKELSGIITPGTKKFFTDGIYPFLWSIAPLAYLGTVRRRID